MKTVYAIRDRIANELVGVSMYLLFAFRTDQQAVRYFADCITDPKSILNKHPADYELVAVAELHDSAAGEIVLADGRHRVVITGDALIAATTEHQPQLVRES